MAVCDEAPRVSSKYIRTITSHIKWWVAVSWHELAIVIVGAMWKFLKHSG